jgi:hypothetical protein
MLGGHHFLIILIITNFVKYQITLIIKPALLLLHLSIIRAVTLVTALGAYLLVTALGAYKLLVTALGAYLQATALGAH